MKKIVFLVVALVVAAGARAQAPKYIFLMIGDGMGLPQVELTRVTAERKLNMLGMPVVGLATTASADHQITDSAAAGTALATGHKANNGVIGLGATLDTLTTIAERARDKGLKVGIVTTVTTDHATPAAFYANVADRDMSDEIRRQQTASRFDHFAGQKPLEGLLSNAIELLDNPDGFFIMAEGGLIDWMGHDNNAQGVIREVLDFDAAVGVALAFYEKHPDETLIIVTADHETGGLTLGNRERKYDSDFARLDGLSWTTGVHTALPAPVFAIGRGAENFAGFYDNTDIPKKIITITEL
jgi:alkaline phosphatase